MNAEPQTIEAEEVETFEHVSEPAGRVVAQAGQSLAARQQQDNLPATATPMAMIDRALAMGADPGTLEKLLALQERWEANQGRKAFDEAMAAAKAEIPTIRKNRTVDFTSSKGRTHYRHEDLAEIASTINPVLGKHGLSYRYRVQSEVNAPISVTCIVSHRLGYSEETTLTGPRDDSGNKNSLQQVGSTLTYLQRMTLKAALGLAASEDDDAKASGQSGGPITEEQASKVRALIEETGTDIAKFCQYLGIEAIPEIPASELPRVLTMLQKKRSAA
ncbi:ERF family protein [Aquamicrobium sp. LC103]|uniref:ERF family protein n=1 Tax=Aquamicrobium sp. LC103 TaxID=1120658 RepID=UPI00069A12B9|nr:ERF family protein [Aquamicrobium sp. LC103]TKT80025.1 ERF family protein [Aquamicrobium sp. LC103]